VSVFDLDNNRRIATVRTGKEPSSVVIAPDDNTFFVANRADATVTRVSGLKSGTFVNSGTVQVGSEPTGVALSPTGARLFVAEFAQSRVSVWDTKTMTRIGVLIVKNPRGLTVTNNGDANDNDETVVVPEFYGKPVPGGEASDTGRLGNVRLFNVGTLRPALCQTAPIAARSKPAPINSGGQLSRTAKFIFPASRLHRLPLHALMAMCTQCCTWQTSAPNRKIRA
jgi:DNA-binding beta-propeller fold protein YncE